MHYTQVELTPPDHSQKPEVWWLPVPEGRAKVGETITRQFQGHTAPDDDGARHSASYSEDWVITQVCTTVLEENIPTPARIASGFVREAQTIAYMSI